MPASAPQNPNQFGFDAQDAGMFRKLVALFDSPSAGEAEAAFRKAANMCARSRRRFIDAIGESFGIAELQQRLAQREAQGEQLADALDDLRRNFAAYRQKAEAEIQQLTRNAGRPRAVPKSGGDFCKGCEWKRRILALIASLPIAHLWFSKFDWSDSETWQNLFGIVLSASPLLAVLLRWRWLNFKQKLIHGFHEPITTSTVRLPRDGTDFWNSSR